ncbi:hypothetical protein PTHTG4_31670 [Parageobacillus thermoglucosidasius]|jgi:hypothetical protein|uniref:PqqD family protein n=1 Tax=Parageobacillus thermoglucosidasius TaxID=1426 RepID=UPI000F6279AC|nr:PqqD family protein [Parageobacillus thermoglucosidasius]GCD84102.1 hypothetical protein PTHTG4_31670 [Parageobacillus thermoglucosidasius]
MKNIKAFEVLKGTVFTEIEGEAVLLNISNGTYYGLDEVGVDIWKYMNKGRSFEEIKSYLVNEYKVQESIIEKDLIDFLTDLENKGLIRTRCS